jgi:hypothetical protein
MKGISKFTLQPLPSEKDDEDETHSALLSDGEPTDVTLDGTSLDAQFEHNQNFILFVTYDSPYSEFLHIYLLDKKFVILDQLQMSKDWATPFQFVGELEIIDPNQLRFSFFGNDLWLLTILEKPEFMLPKLPILSLYWKPLRFAFAPGYLQLQGK